MVRLKDGLGAEVGALRVGGAPWPVHEEIPVSTMLSIMEGAVYSDLWKGARRIARRSRMEIRDSVPGIDALVVERGTAPLAKQLADVSGPGGTAPRSALPLVRHCRKFDP